LAVAALGAAGARTQADQPPNPFAGNWSGAWSVNEGGVFGTFDWTISDGGRISGTVDSTTAVPGNGKIGGHVDADGNLRFIGWAPSDTPDLGANGFPFLGTAEIDDDGNLVASLERADGGYVLVVNLERD
jgi:hypothetical protein